MKNIVKRFTESDTWLIIFSILAAVVVGTITYTISNDSPLAIQVGSGSLVVLALFFGIITRKRKVKALEKEGKKPG